VGFVLLIIAMLLALVCLLLTVPITVEFRIDRIKEIKGQVIFYWLFGLVRFRIGIPGAGKAVPQHKRKPKGKNSKSKRDGFVHGVFALLKQSAFRRRAIRLIKDLLHATHAHDFYLRLRIGLGDPADTGRLWGLIGPFAGITKNLSSTKIHIEPDFLAPVLEVEIHCDFHLIPIQFIALVTAFVVSPTILHGWYTLRRSIA